MNRCNVTLAVTMALMLAGCATGGPGRPSATVTLDPTTGNRIVATARLMGLTPGPHGFHIHEKGDCSSGDGMSAGGHFNPRGKPHASVFTVDRHAGDLPMVVADAAGNATLVAELDLISIGSGDTDIVGRGLIVHKDPDDFQTQPTGNSGARVACGVITRS
jgi:Cu-Zn family superoxide dismutase